MKLEQVASVLNEYGSALRGDWGSIDGRSEQGTILDFAGAILSPEKYTVALLRNAADICPEGGGHWTEHCDDHCEESD